MKTSQKLKQCPACGCEKIKRYNWDGDYWAICSICGITSRPCLSNKQVTDAWNDRRPASDRK